MALKTQQPIRTLTQLLSQLKSREDLRDRIKHVEMIAASPARFHDWPKTLSKDLIRILEKSGYGALWTHQAHAVEALHRGSHVAVTTPTRSEERRVGKEGRSRW